MIVPICLFVKYCFIYIDIHEYSIICHSTFHSISNSYIIIVKSLHVTSLQQAVFTEATVALGAQKGSVAIFQW